MNAIAEAPLLPQKTRDIFQCFRETNPAHLHGEGLRKQLSTEEKLTFLAGKQDISIASLHHNSTGYLFHIV
jgi:hypothetical protein